MMNVFEIKDPKGKNLGTLETWFPTLGKII
jgi:hypothetical protein